MNEEEYNEVLAMKASDAQEAVVALSELRGWVVHCPRHERDFLLPRIDTVLKAFGVDQVVARIHGDVLEGWE